MRWSDFAARQPGFAAIADHQLLGPGVVLIGTTNAQHVARWPAGEEYLRPVLTPTSLGPPQPVSQILTTS